MTTLYTIWVRTRNCSCLVTWFCYQMIAKPGNKTATVPWPNPYANMIYHIFIYMLLFFIYGNLSYQVLYKITWTTQKWQDYSRCNTWELVPVNDVSFIGDILFSLCWLCFCVLLLWQWNDIMYMCLWHKWQIKMYKLNYALVNCTIIVSDNGLSPGWCQAITDPMLKYC